MSSRKRLSIGLIAVGTKGWIGGITYVESIARACRTLPAETAPRLFLVLTDESLPAFSFYRETLSFCEAVIYRGTHPLAEIAEQLREQLPPGCPLHSFRGPKPPLDLLFPSSMGLIDGANIVGWIPDLQHLGLSEFFSPEEIAERTRLIRNLIATRRPIVVSSESGKADLLRHFGLIPAPLHVLNFHTTPRPEWFAADPAPVVREFDLPEKYLICCNQFWQHKNHLAVFQAIELLSEKGIDLTLVCTGPTHDTRWPGFFDSLMERIRGTRSFSRIKFLGLLSRDAQIQLIRASLAMVQPSRFEGWSTVVEDARALGKTLFLSRIPVHEEQAPPHALFFDPSRPEELARAIEEALPSLRPGPDRTREQEAKWEVDLKMIRCGEAFLAIAEEAARPAQYWRSLPPYLYASLKRTAARAARKIRRLAAS